ncbi:MAG: ion channel [Planctomycetota bacterium]
MLLHVLVAPYALRDPSAIAAVIVQALFFLLLTIILVDLATHRPLMITCIILVLAASTLRLLSSAIPISLHALADAALALCGIITLVMAMRWILLARRATPALISGAVSIYLLAGITWAIVFHALESLHPGSFSAPGTSAIADASDLYYFSFVTLTTLGYGDVNPITAPARSISVFEAVFGQIFLVVLLGRLVSLQISNGVSPEKHDSMSPAK